MNVYRVITDRDGPTTRTPGRTDTEIIRESHMYAAESMEQVWQAIEWLRQDHERTLVAIICDHEGVHVLPADAAARQQEKL
jgi:hypothetical protein